MDLHPELHLEAALGTSWCSLTTTPSPVYLFCYARVNFDPKLTLRSKGDQSTAMKCRVGQEMSLVMLLNTTHSAKTRSLPCGYTPGG